MLNVILMIIIILQFVSCFYWVEVISDIVQRNFTKSDLTIGHIVCFIFSMVGFVITVVLLTIVLLIIKMYLIAKPILNKRIFK